MSAAESLGDPMLVPRIHEVLDVIDEIPEVVTLRVAPIDGVPEPFLPAQVGMLGAFGIGEAPISISSAVTERRYHDYTIRRAGAITSALTAMLTGDRFWVRGPFGTAWDLDHPGDDVLIAGGGIGTAPLRSAIYAVLDDRDRFGRATLVVGARSSALLLYAREFDEWRARGLDVVATIDAPEPGWVGPVGMVPEIVDGVDLVADRTRALICGPDIMMRLAADALIARGLAPERIQVTLERNMQCGNGLCGHCQLGPLLVCRDGPVVSYDRVAAALATPEL